MYTNSLYRIFIRVCLTLSVNKIDFIIITTHELIYYYGITYVDILPIHYTDKPLYTYILYNLYTS